MKQKIVIKVSTNGPKCFLSYINCFCCDKDRKAFQIAAGFSGVEKASYVGSDKEKIEVAGDRVDAVKLTNKLKRKVGFAVLESVAEVKADSDEKKKKEEEEKKKKEEEDKKKIAAAVEAFRALQPLPPPLPPPAWPYAICDSY